MDTDSNALGIPAPIRGAKVHEYALRISRTPAGNWIAEVISRTFTWASVIDARSSNGRSLTLGDIIELLATISDAIQSELLSQGGIQIALGDY